jgi:hypothetical protein
MDYFNSGARPDDAPPMWVNTAALTCARTCQLDRGFQRKRMDTRFAQRRVAQLCDASLRSNLLRHDRSRVVFPASYDSCHSLKRFSSSVTLSAHQSSSMIALFGLVKSGRSRWVSGFRSATAAVLLGE